MLRKQGKEVVSQVLAFEVMPAPPAIASLLRIKIDERIYFSRRVRYVDGKPLMLEDSYMPVKLFRNLSLSHLEGSKFDYIEKECGIIISGNYETLTPVLADKQLARSMNVPEQTPLLRITSLSYSDSGEFLNYSVMFRNRQRVSGGLSPAPRPGAKPARLSPQNSTASSCGVIMRRNITSG
ncbi:HTH-type transcriptional regulator YidP [Klebsiella pneumoniae]|uniref:HTH-type transcriptional regulator YidP n=1 Tax=Klebsiella pneumoniae TaxID=573 RepID=A0A377UQJ0_KLEPN|nr:HTH-type transcriptional regulator YidP [Klebsiella pneumoniae]